MTYEAYLEQLKHTNNKYETLISDFKNKVSFSTLMKQHQEMLDTHFIKMREGMQAIARETYYNVESSKARAKKMTAKKFFRNIGNALISFASGAIDGVVSFFSGATVWLRQLLIDFQELFKTDGRFKSAAREFFSDLGGLILDVFQPIVHGLPSGVMGLLDAFGIKDAGDANNDFQKIWTKARYDILYKGSDKDIFNKGLKQTIHGDYGTNFTDTEYQQMLDQLDARGEFKTAEDNIQDVGNILSVNKWVRKNITAPMTDWARDETDPEWVQIGQSVSESLGNVAGAAIAGGAWGKMAGYGAGTTAATAKTLGQIASSTYFHFSAFGSAFEDAIDKGNSVQKSFEYASAVAAIETGTELIGGVMPWGEVSGKGFMKLVSGGLGEGFEEALSELSSGGVEAILTGETDNTDVLKRTWKSAVAGALSGVIVGGIGIAAEKNYYRKHPFQNLQRKENFNKRIVEAFQGEKNAGKKLYNETKKRIAWYEFHTQDKQGNVVESKLNDAKHYLNNYDNGLESILIEFDDTTNKPKMTKYAETILSDFESFERGYQKGKGLDTDVAISKNRMGGVVHNDNLEFATLTEIENIQDEKKKGLIKDLLNKNKDIAFIKNKDTTQGGYDKSNGFTYINVNLDNSQIIGKVAAHELTHKLADKTFGFERTGDKVVRVVKNKKLAKLYNNIATHIQDDSFRARLQKAEITPFTNKHIETYTQEYKKQIEYEKLNDTQKQEANRFIQDLIAEEMVAHFVEVIASDKKTIQKLFKVSPEFLESFSDILDTVEDVSSEVKDIRKTLNKYAKASKKIRNGSLLQAIKNTRQQRTFINVDGKLHTIKSEKAGFVNTEHEDGAKANINETRRTRDKKGNITQRKYSEFSKQELNKFYTLFDATQSFDNNVDSIIENVLLDYHGENDLDYKEIVGTKLAYLWSIMEESPEIKKAITEKVNAKINEVLKDTSKKKVRNQDLHTVKESKQFRQLFILNQIVSDPNVAVGSFGKTLTFYNTETENMYITEDGKTGFAITNDQELISVFNTNDKTQISDFKDFISDRAKYINVITNAFLGLNNLDLSVVYGNSYITDWSNSYYNTLLEATENKNIKIDFENVFMKSVKVDNHTFINTDGEQETITIKHSDKGFVVEEEINNIKGQYQISKNTLNENDYFNRLKEQESIFENINKTIKEIKNKPNSEVFAKALKDISRARKKVIDRHIETKGRYQRFNHLYQNILQEIGYQIVNNTNDKGIIDKFKFMDDLTKTITDTIAYVDKNIYSDTEMLSGVNPEGKIYKGIYEDLKVPSQTNNSLIVLDMLEIIRESDFSKKDNVFPALINILTSTGEGSLYNLTATEQISSLNPNSNKIGVVSEVVRNNIEHISTLQDLVGRVVVSPKGKKERIGLLGKNFQLLNRLDASILDIYAFSNAWGLFMENSLGDRLQVEFTQAQEKFLTVMNLYHEHFEENKFNKKHQKDLRKLEKTFYEIKNIINANEQPMTISASQLLDLRNSLMREYVRNKIIKLGIRKGAISTHFKDGGRIVFEGIEKSPTKAKQNRQQGKIVNVLDLLNEVNAIIQKNDFYKLYNDKLLTFFDKLYDFSNTRYMDLYGVRLTSDNKIIATLTNDQKAQILDGLNETELNNIYTPFRTENRNIDKQDIFDIKSVLEYGVYDGMVQGITENTEHAVITSVNKIVPSYTKSVANYYGLYRLMTDMNVVFASRMGDRYVKNAISDLSEFIEPFYKKLLQDIAGYGIENDYTTNWFNRTMGVITKNFYRATLALNLKVILTQFASFGTLSTIYGNNPAFTLKMMANLFNVSKQKQAHKMLTKGKGKSEFYIDRNRSGNHDVGVATKQAFVKNKIETVIESLMDGITFTDSLINRSLYITVYDDFIKKGATQQEAHNRAKAIMEEGIRHYQSTALQLGKSQLLRSTNNILRMFTKFMGEPLKVVSNLRDSHNHLKIIKAFEKNLPKIKEFYDNKIEKSKETLSKIKQELQKTKTKYENTTNKEIQKDLEKEIKTIEKEIATQEKRITDQARNRDDLLVRIEKVIAGKTNAKKLLGKRLWALTKSISWQAFLHAIFGLLRTGGRDKEDDEKMIDYLGKKFGFGLASEFFQMLPFVRDAYSGLVEGFAIDEIDEFGVFNDLIKAIRGFATDTISGGKTNYLKHFRNISFPIGRAFGIPMKNIERIFTTPTNFLLKEWNYTYRDATGQRVSPNKELERALKSNDIKLAKTIIERQLASKGISLTDAAYKEIERLNKSGARVNPSAIPKKFTIENIEYKNDYDKFNNTYNKATFVIEKLTTSTRYKGLSNESKAKLINSVFNYYYKLAKQETSGVKLIPKERVYNLQKAYSYFNGRTSYYYKQDKKNKKRG